MADDEDLLQRIHKLVDEEHQLHAAHQGRGLTDEEVDRLQEVEVGLDQCWDLMRQRRALRHAGQDPNQAHVRPAGTVEGYQQ